MSFSVFRQWTSGEIYDRLMDHLINGIVFLQDELHLNDPANPTYTNDSPTTYTYTMQCGLPDLTTGTLVSVERVWGLKANNGYDFVYGTDYTVNLDNNSIIFTSTTQPDSVTNFYVTYRYYQGYQSGLSASGVGSNINMIFNPIALRFGELYTSMGQIKQAFQIKYASGSDLDELVKLFNMTRKSPVGATGWVQIYRNSSSVDQTVSIGSTFRTIATSTVNAVLFETTQQVAFYNGNNSAKVPVQAATGYEGLKSNVKAGSIINVVSAGVCTAVNNPDFFSDYEYIDTVIGRNTYTLTYRAERVINSSAYPADNFSHLSVADKGFMAVIGYSDKSLNSTNWAVGSGAMTLTPDTPETGITKISVTTAGYIELSGLSIPKDATAGVEGYDELMIYLRSTSNLRFQIYIIDGTSDKYIDLYRFNDGVDYGSGIYTTQTMNSSNVFQLFHGAHRIGDTNPITAIRIYFLDVGDYYVDWIAAGTFLQEVNSTALANSDEVSVSYTSKLISIYLNSSGTDFFAVYSSKQLMLYYQWDNLFSGGADEENDSELRYRAQKAFQSQETATKTAIESAILNIDGISQCNVQDYNDDPSIPAGNCYIYVIADGYYLSPQLQDSVLSMVTTVIGGGIRPVLYTPEIRYVNFTVKFYYSDKLQEYSGSAGQTQLTTIIQSAISDFFSTMKINEDFHASAMIGFVMNEVDAVIGGAVKYTVNVEPTYSDDNFSGPYAFGDGTEIIQDSYGEIYVSATKTGATLVVQGGNNIIIELVLK